jgi:hypothetical protein
MSPGFSRPIRHNQHQTRRERGNPGKKAASRRRQPLLGGPVSGQMAHQQREIVREGRRELALGEVLAPAQGGAPVFTMVEHMAEAAFEMLAALSQQYLAAFAFHRLFGFSQDLPDDGVLVLGLVDHVTGAVFGHADLGVGIDADLGGEAFDILQVLFPGVAVDQRAQACQDELESRLIDGGSGAAAAGGVGVGGQADLADAFGEPDGIERLVELAVEGAGCGLWQAAGIDPEFLLRLGGGFAGLKRVRAGFKQISPVFQ